MLNKSIGFGLLAFGLMVAPTTAFAGSQSQSNVQTNEQNGAATNGSTTAQSAQSINQQVQGRIQKARGGYGYRSYCPTRSISQTQHSAQGTSQNGAATDGSTNAQSSSTVNTQTQYSRAGRGC